ncbi:MAG: SLBB domain-containing protein, partial [Chitinophagaceae bacterium]|nr:SLBB domain-containing protein [Chitinophagaceae bacterium]
MSFFILSKICTPARFKILLIFIAVTIGGQYVSKAQNPDELGNVRVEELSDDQLRHFAIEANRLGISDDQIEQLALQRGMNPLEMVKLKDKLQYIRKSMGATSPPAVNQRPQERRDSISVQEEKPLADYGTIFSAIKSNNFGFDVFNNPRLTFEPNLRLATPPDYQLAPDDELLIDVSGYSEASYRLKVSTEGIVRIPLAGPVPVNGLTMSAAKKRITEKLSSTIYSGIRTGKTFVDVTLAAIRSIRVAVVGEATLPGAYSLPSIASAYHALYACGGPGPNGSFRNIEVIRNNQVISTIDVYDYLRNGTKRNDVRLMDQDIIKINPYGVRIELKGEIKKPGMYDVQPGETLQKIFGYAGGFTDNAYTARIQVFQNTTTDRQVITLGEAQLASIIPKRGDTYVISKILNRFTNRISISGAVYRPGDYELREGMTLSTLISEADGLREDAFTSRGTIHRLNADLSPALLSFDLDKINSKQSADITLQREDRITIFSRFDLKEGYYVRIDGEVSSPGTFLFEQGVTIPDLILMAGGLRESALLNRIEVSRRVKGADSITPKMALIFQQDIAADLRDSASLAAFPLLPFDEVSVRPAPGYFAQRNVVVEGELRYVGKYTLQTKNERISDLIKRAGGLTPQAYLEGAVLVRSRNFSRMEQNNSRQGLNNLVRQNLQNGTSATLVQNQYQEAIGRKSDNVGIDLPRIMETPGSDDDLFLNDGDTLRVPKQLQTVRVNGEVLYPTLVRYDDGYSFKDYITGAGGFNERSLKKRAYVVNANGSARGTKSFLFFRNYPRVTPGA